MTATAGEASEPSCSYMQEELSPEAAPVLPFNAPEIPASPPGQPAETRPVAGDVPADMYGAPSALFAGCSCSRRGAVCVVSTRALSGCGPPAAGEAEEDSPIAMDVSAEDATATEAAGATEEAALAKESQPRVTGKRAPRTRAAPSERAAPAKKAPPKKRKCVSAKLDALSARCVWPAALSMRRLS
jgi:hypothetical protein